MNIELTENKTFDAKYIKVSAQVRYWDDATINGEADEDGDLTPFANGDLWGPVIDIDSGFVLDWPKDTVASIHFKVCDAGSYYLMNKDKEVIASIEQNYVPDGLCHGDEGFGDYIIMNIDKDGKIQNYRPSINASDWIED